MRKSILITGCSSGIGLCAAKTLHQRGYQVFATARKQEDLAKLTALGVESVALDLTCSESIQKALAIVLEKTGGTLDALFNNAGYVQAGAVEDLTRDLMQAQFETNVFGPMELTNQVIPIMRKQGHGRIIQNSSILGIITMPYRGAYNASKFALEGFTNTLRQELRGTRIFVTSIAPGPIHSRLRENSLLHHSSYLYQKESVHQVVYQHMKQHYFNLDHKAKQYSSGPEAVVKKLILALESNKPKAHYYITSSACLFAFLKRILPDSVLDWLMVTINNSEIPISQSPKR